MHRNPIWLGFLGLIFIAALYFAGVAAWSLYRYEMASESAPATITEWSIVQIGSEHYVPKATYFFSIDEKRYEGETTFEFSAFRNEWATGHQIKKFSTQNWRAWFHPSNPEDSMLDKRFPLWPLISGLLTVGIFFYFLWLGFYVSRKSV